MYSGKGICENYAALVLLLRFVVVFAGCAEAKDCDIAAVGWIKLRSGMDGTAVMVMAAESIERVADDGGDLPFWGYLLAGERS